MNILCLFQLVLVVIAFVMVGIGLTNTTLPSTSRVAREAVPRQQKARSPTAVTRAEMRTALQDLWSARMSLLASKQRAKHLIAISKKEGATWGDKRAAAQAIAAIRNDVQGLKTTFRTVKSLRKRGGVIPKKPTALAANQLALARDGRMTVSKRAPVQMSRRTVLINGRRLPVNCYCAKQRAGESRCYFFTRGRYCSARYCAASYVCVGKRRSRGTLCLLRRVRTRVVPVKKNICRNRRINASMYVPYERY